MFVNEPGPFQLYVEPVGVAVRLNVFPTHTGVLLDAVGAVGVTLTVTENVPALLLQPVTVATTEYVPDAAVLTLDMVGFCKVEVKLFGPLQV